MRLPDPGPSRSCWSAALDAKVPEITHVLTEEPSLQGADQAARFESRQPGPAERVGRGEPAVLLEQRLTTGPTCGFDRPCDSQPARPFRILHPSSSQANYGDDELISELAGVLGAKANAVTVPLCASPAGAITRPAGQRADSSRLGGRVASHETEPAHPGRLPEGPGPVGRVARRARRAPARGGRDRRGDAGTAPRGRGGQGQHRGPRASLPKRGGQPGRTPRARSVRQFTRRTAERSRLPLALAAENAAAADLPD